MQFIILATRSQWKAIKAHSMHLKFRDQHIAIVCIEFIFVTTITSSFEKRAFII